jgi:hypothetical protein
MGIVGAALFVIGAIATTRHDHTAFGQGYVFWLMLGLAAWALSTHVHIGPTYKR